MRRVENGDMREFIADNIKPFKRLSRVYVGRNFKLK